MTFVDKESFLDKISSKVEYISFMSSENNSKAKPGEPFERSNKKLISSDFSLSLRNKSILLKPSKDGFSKLNFKQRDLKVANKLDI